MHDESMRHEDEASAFDLDLNPDLDMRIERALEAQPEVLIPADFAARVASRVPARRKMLSQEMRVRTTRYGYWMMGFSMVVLMVAMLALAPLSTGSSALWIVVEWGFCVQFMLLASWFGLRRQQSL